MITDHPYDAGWPRDDSKGCIAEVHTLDDTEPCGKPEREHSFSEYSKPYTKPPGAMHEPAPYAIDGLEWADQTEGVAYHGHER